MKRIRNIILAFFTLILLVGCNSWLDVQPRTEEKKENMFKSQQGFREVLIGAYLRMKDSGLYGGELTWGLVESLAQHWEPNPNTPENSLSYYRFDEAENEISLMYYNLYQMIGDVNSILEVIDEHKNVFSGGNYQLIKAEALAIRAYCHFNILQLFGPVPTQIGDNRILSYVKTVSTNVHDSYSFKEFVDLLLEDLNQAEELFLEVDPICQYSIYELNHLSLSSFKPEDDFWAYRQHRMNYYSILGEKARIYHWCGEKEKAAEYAFKLIWAKDKNGKIMYPLGSFSDINSGDLVLSCEHILNVYIYNLTDVVQRNFSNSGKYYATTDKINEIIPSGSTDIRKSLWRLHDTDTKRSLFLKYNQGKSLYEPSCVVPLMRISEMYFIAMECAPIKNARALYYGFCEARNIMPGDVGNEQQMQTTLLKEYNREFYGEGKLFYAYKRLAVPSSKILWKPFSGTKTPSEMYILPLPKREIIFNK